jgi:5-methylcytosine-specific restriction endonuclease McrA
MCDQAVSSNDQPRGGLPCLPRFVPAPRAVPRAVPAGGMPPRAGGMPTACPPSGGPLSAWACEGRVRDRTRCPRAAPGHATLEVRAALTALGVACALVAALAAGCEPGSLKDRPVILFCADNQGVLAACGCPSNPSGGLAKRAAMIEAYRRTRPDVVVLDAGDVVPDYPHPVKVKYVAMALERSGYDAIGLGDQEFALGLDRLKELQRDYKLPLVCANVRDASGVPVVPPHVIREVGRTPLRGRIGIFAVVADRAYGWPPVEWRKGLAVEPPAEAARREVRDLAGCDLIVALAHQPLAESRELAAAVPGIDVIVCGHEEEALPRGERIGATLLVSTGEAGRILGALSLGARPGSPGRRRGKPGGKPGLALGMTELSAQVPDAKWAMDLYWQYVKEAKDKPPPDWNLTPIPPAYDTAEACGKCHPAEYKQWLTTRHARAYESIRKVKRQDDPECLLCHTVGLGRAGGFVSMAQTPALGRVTCQGCHAVTADHADKGVKPEPRINVNSRVCMSCHGPVQSPDFDYFVYKPRIRHKPPETK